MIEIYYGPMGADKEDALETIYVNLKDRFVVALIVSYSEQELRDGSLKVSTANAAYSALELTRDSGSYGTHWFVFDRKTGTGEVLEQGDFEDGDFEGEDDD